MPKSSNYHPYRRSNTQPSHVVDSFSQGIDSVVCHSLRIEKRSPVVSQGPKQTDVEELAKACSKNIKVSTRIYCGKQNNFDNDHGVEFNTNHDVNNESECSDDLPDLEDTYGRGYLVKTTGYETQRNEYRGFIETPFKKLKLADGLPVPKTEISESKDSPRTQYPILFTKEHKTRLAELLSKVKLKESQQKVLVSRSNSPTLSSNSQNSERHFMDILDSLNNKGKLPNESDTTESLRTPLPYSDSNSSPLKEYCRRNVKFFQARDNENSSSVECVKTSPDNRVTKEKTTLEWVENHKSYVEEQKNVDSFSDDISVESPKEGCDLPVHIAEDTEIEVPIPYEPEKPHGLFFRTNRHHASLCKVSFPDARETDVIESFSAMHITYLEAAVEEGDQFFDASLDMLKRFVLQKKPTKEIINMLLHKGLLGHSNTDVNMKSFSILRYIWQMYPDLISIDWELLSDVIDGTTIKKEESSYTNSQGGLLLNLYVMGLEIDLYIISLKNRQKLIKTFVYKYLSVDVSFRNLKKIVRWIDFCLTSASTESLENQAKLREGESSNFDFDAPYKLLFDLNRLLFFGIEISKSCNEAVNRIVDDFKKVYTSQVEVGRRKLLLQFLSSDLLVLVLTQRVLEENFDVTEITFPMSFKELKHLCFSSKSRVLFHKNSDACVDEKYSAECVEELCFLVFYIVRSYVVCKKREFHQPLHMRGNAKALTEEDEVELQALADEACQFYLHLQALLSLHVPTLSTVTEQYVILLTCLSEAKVN